MSAVSLKRHRTWLRIILLGGLLCCVLVLGAAPYYSPENMLVHTWEVRFEWNVAHGFQSFKLDPSPARINGLSRYLVGLQIKPALAAYLKRGQFDHASGFALLIVGRILPVAIPRAWGSGGMELDTDVTQLMRAAARGNADAVRKLLIEGADVHARDWLGRTPLLHACDNNVNPDVVKALLEAGAGADVNVPDKGRGTPLISVMWTAGNDIRAIIVHDLLDSGADVNAKDISGVTPLMAAASVGDAAVVAQLLQRGADFSVRDSQGASALSLAEQQKHFEVIKLLRRAGAQH